MRKTLLIILAFLPLALMAQRLEVIGSGGQYLSRGGVNISATIGEVFVATPSGSKHFATEGFQQGYLLPDLAASRTETPASLSAASLFPNPTADRVQVSLQNMSNQPVRLTLYNSVGKLIQESETNAEIHFFNVASLPAGHYWIAVQTDENSPVISLPFEKINQ